MHEPLEPAGVVGSTTAGTEAEPCSCPCLEPQDGEASTAAPADRTGVAIEVYWDVNGDPAPEAD